MAHLKRPSPLRGTAERTAERTAHPFGNFLRFKIKCVVRNNKHRWNDIIKKEKYYETEPIQYQYASKLIQWAIFLIVKRNYITTPDSNFYGRDSSFFLKHPSALSILSHWNSQLHYIYNSQLHYIYTSDISFLTSQSFSASICSSLGYYIIYSYYRQWLVTYCR